MKFYIATRLERHAEHNDVRNRLQALGHTITYDWTLRGAVRDTSAEDLTGVCLAEVQGVLDADFVVVLLPGGRGTHVELGIALAAGKPVILHAVNSVPFLPTEATSAFYHHPLVRHTTGPLPVIVVPVLELERARTGEDIVVTIEEVDVPSRVLKRPEAIRHLPDVNLTNHNRIVPNPKQVGWWRVRTVGNPEQILWVWSDPTDVTWVDTPTEHGPLAVPCTDPSFDWVAQVEADCRTCKHAGADPDGPYCAHPEVLKKFPSGLNLASQSTPRWQEDECGKAGRWWAQKEPR